MAVCTAGQLEGLAHAYLAAVLQGKCRKPIPRPPPAHPYLLPALLGMPYTIHTMHLWLI